MSRENAYKCIALFIIFFFFVHSDTYSAYKKANYVITLKIIF